MGRVLKFRAGRFGTSAMAVALVTMTGLSVVAQSTPALASPFHHLGRPDRSWPGSTFRGARRSVDR